MNCTQTFHSNPCLFPTNHVASVSELTEQLLANTDMSRYPSHTNIGYQSNLNNNNNNNNPHVWSHQVPSQMPWMGSAPGIIQPQQDFMRFTGEASPQICPPPPTHVSAPFVPPEFFSTVYQPGIQQQQQYIPTRVLVDPVSGVPSQPQPQPTAQAWIQNNFTPSPPTTSTRRASIKRGNSSSSDEEDDDLSDLQPPTKQYATADRVAAKLNNLSLSKEQEASKTSVPRHRRSVQVIEIEELNDDEGDEYLDLDQDPNAATIELSDEVQSLIQGNPVTDRMVNEIFKNELEKPSKALIPWSPSSVSSLLPIVETVDSSDDDDCQTASTKKNNNQFKPSSKSTISSGLVIQELDDDEDPFSEMLSTPLIQEEEDLTADDLEVMEEDL